jgi:HK97 family phage portal protein
MSFWDRFKRVKAFRYGAASLIPWMEAPDSYNLDSYLKAYSQVYSLFGIALRIATGVGEVKWRLYKGSDRSERSQIAEHPILNLLDYANEFQTGQEIIELTQLHIDLAGRAYWYLAYNKLGIPNEIWVLPPNKVKIVPSEQDFIAGYTYTSGVEKIPLERREIIRFTMPDPLNPYGAVGYVQPSVVEIDSENYAGKWNRNFFFNSARADAVLEYEDKLTDEEFERLREQWRSKYQGLSRAHKIAILEGGVKYKQIQIAQKDMDFAELRKQTRENLLFTFGMPLSVMGISENVNRANAEAGDYTFARWLVKPRLTRIKNKLNEQLVPKFPKAKGVELDHDEVVPETVEQKRELGESGVKAGWMTINEARKLNGLDPVPNGDVFLIPFNMLPTPADKPIQAPPSAEAPKSKSIFEAEAQKEAFWKVYITKAENYERLLVKSLKDMFSKQEKLALERFKNDPRPNINLIDQSEARKQFTEAVETPLKDLLINSLEDAADFIGKQSPATRYALTWLASRITWAAEEVGDETERLLSKELHEGFEAGEGMEVIARRIEGVFNGCRKNRAIRISRTETIMASNEGALYGYEQSGVVEKVEFYTALDERTCEECSSMHGQEFVLAESHGVIPLHPMCRCTWLPVI